MPVLLTWIKGLTRKEKRTAQYFNLQSPVIVLIFNRFISQNFHAFNRDKTSRNSTVNRASM